ncbi:zinc finger and SCAN domain-containing protein 32 [Caretta caretta]|uniref:zinc finger and SCAN domain-containing protein 32 n=1 Tax=Caretta caretta TaxID=8467 RepID=UPI003F4BCAD9
MQSSSAEVTMMESQNRKRAPAWTEREVLDLIAVWGEESVLSELRSSFRNVKTFVKISQGMKDKGHNRDPKQCCVKLKELRQAYQKTRGANGRSGSEPQTCRFYDELHAILGVSATTTPAVLFDSFNGDGGNMEAGFGDKEEEDDDEEEVVASIITASKRRNRFSRQPGTVSHPGPGASTPRTHPRLPPGPGRWRRDLRCMCFNDHRIFSFPEASED